MCVGASVVAGWLSMCRPSLNYYHIKLQILSFAVTAKPGFIASSSALFLRSSSNYHCGVAYHDKPCCISQFRGFGAWSILLTVLKIFWHFSGWD